MTIRLVATSDTHFPVDHTIIPDGDVFIHAGDFMTKGYEDEWKPALDWLNALPHKIKILVPGNHDYHLKVYPGPALQDLRRIGVTVLGLPTNPNYISYTLENGKTILGLPFVCNLPHWAFNVTEKYITGYLKNIGRHDIIVSHSPAYKTLDIVNNIGTKFMPENVGIKAYRDWMDIHNPSIWICGHIHEAYGYLKINDTNYYNVAMCNRKYIQENKPIIIDV